MLVNLWHNGMKNRLSYGAAKSIQTYNILFEEINMSGFHLYGAVLLYFAHLNAGSSGTMYFIYTAGAAMFMALGFADEKDKRK